MDESRLVAICSEHGRLFFNPPVVVGEEELAHAVYRFLIGEGELISEWEN